MTQPEAESKRGSRALALFFFAYVVAVLILDTLALEGRTLVVDWSKLRWRDGSFDLFKFVAWFVIPAVLALWTVDVHYFTFRRWKKIDWALLGVIVVGGAFLMLALPSIPGVNEYYRGWGHLPDTRRWDLAQSQLIWTVSWLTGWEFMHRYLLPKHLTSAFPKWGWLAVLILVPALEAFYHVIQQKAALECLGMGALSIVLCAWTLRRRNMLLPFLGHLAIEVELVTFLYFN